MPGRAVSYGFRQAAEAGPPSLSPAHGGDPLAETGQLACPLRACGGPRRAWALLPPDGHPASTLSRSVEVTMTEPATRVEEFRSDIAAMRLKDPALGRESLLLRGGVAGLA